ncbi:hypothetical protein AN963_21385 [Brevibacillus choshinensis]|uniref:Transposase n=1 Tax=Brevibacillus choshinensis TaxID=54911 RepID=A0ABR5N0L8_BRECH|nr:hypothetical protein [Brevibacillus choshinensis]KQL44001.1 hypothetical protein AN963_21385 [Brevibacillus choshinensis]
MPRPRIKLHNAKDISATISSNHDYDNLLAAYRLQDEKVKRLYAEFCRLKKRLEVKNHKRGLVNESYNIRHRDRRHANGNRGIENPF